MELRGDCPEAKTTRRRVLLTVDIHRWIARLTNNRPLGPRGCPCTVYRHRAGPWRPEDGMKVSQHGEVGIGCQTTLAHINRSKRPECQARLNSRATIERRWSARSGQA